MSLIENFDSTLKMMKMSKKWLAYKTPVLNASDGSIALDKEGNPKQGKVPYYLNGSPRRGKLDGPEYILNLGTYQEACAALEDRKLGFVGLGFALGFDSEFDAFWQGIDVDDVVLKGLERIANEVSGYAEMSPSGQGMHAIGIGKDFKNMGSNSSGLEAYSSARFFTVTLNSIRDTKPVCLASYVEDTLHPIHSSHARSTASKGGDGVSNNICTERSGLNSFQCTEKSLQIRTVAPQTITELRSALMFLRSDDRDLWVSIGIALRELDEVGRELWLSWSSGSDKFNLNDAEKTWSSFKPIAAGIESVFFKAQEAGWLNPNSNAANIRENDRKIEYSVDASPPSIVELEYLDDPYVPKGIVVGVYGRGESAKSTFVSTIVARNSDRYSTLWLSTEENENHIKIRFLKSGGCENSIAIANGEVRLLEDLENLIITANTQVGRPIGFVVLDTAVALAEWGRGKSANDDGAVKEFLKVLGLVASRMGVSILIIGHTNKGKDHAHVTDSVMGSSSWTSSLRLCYMLQKVPDEDFLFLLRVIKSNLIMKFGQIFETCIVHEMRPNIDNISPVLCRADLSGDRTYGERKISGIHAKLFNEEQDAETKRYSKIERLLFEIVALLGDGEEKSRSQIEYELQKDISPRTWKKLDESLEDRSVSISPVENNKYVYSLQESVLKAGD